MDALLLIHFGAFVAAFYFLWLIIGRRPFK